ncbi:MAG: YegS/Rv2252/BmrU family lipid kinase, partial [Thermoplasmatota archaeon]
RTSVAGDAEKIAQRHRNADLDVISACGGDGTIYEVVNGMAGSGKAIGIIPLGSGNDTIVSISGGKRSIDDCIEDIVKGGRHPIDLGKLNDRYFLNVVGVGMDAAINHEVANRRDLVRRLGPTVHYFFCTFKVIPTWKDMDLLLSENGKEPYRMKAKMLTVGNGTVCGGGFRLTPKARMDDGLLDLSLIRGAGILKTMVNVPKAYKGKHLKLKDLTVYKKIRTLSLTTPGERELPFHIDGEKGFARKMDLSLAEGMMWTVHRLEGAR